MENRTAVRSALVTGASGFVGRNLVEDLLERGYAVTCLVRSTSSAKDLQRLPVKLITGDLSDSSSLREAVKGVRTVYHVAGAIKAPDRDGFFRVNQLGTRRLLEAIADVNPELGKFIHVSSLSAAGPGLGTRALTEDDTPNPISWYGESKLAGEREVLQYAGKFPVTVIRPSAVYGPHDRETLMIFRMINRGCLFVPGRQVRHFSLIHAKDLTSCLIRAAESATPSGEVFFASRPEIFTWDDVGRAISSALEKPYRKVAFARQLACAAGLAGDVCARITGRAVTVSSQKVRELLHPFWTCDCSKAMKCLGFVPRITLEEGIAETVRWYRSRAWL